MGTETFSTEAKDQFGQKTAERIRGKGAENSLSLGDANREYVTHYQDTHNDKHGQREGNRVSKEEIARMRTENFVKGFNGNLLFMKIWTISCTLTATGRKGAKATACLARSLTRCVQQTSSTATTTHFTAVPLTRQPIPGRKTMISDTLAIITHTIKRSIRKNHWLACIYGSCIYCYIRLPESVIKILLSATFLNPCHKCVCGLDGDYSKGYALIIAVVAMYINTTSLNLCSVRSSHQDFVFLEMVWF